MLLLFFIFFETFYRLVTKLGCRIGSFVAEGVKQRTGLQCHYGTKFLLFAAHHSDASHVGQPLTPFEPIRRYTGKLICFIHRLYLCYTNKIHPLAF